LTKLESNIAEINNSTEKVFNFLSNLNNFEKLMPEQVINWKSTEDSCSFTIKGMTDLSLRISEKFPFTKIIIIPGDNPPFGFSLVCQLEEKKPGQTFAQIVFNAELSMMLEMIAKSPLQNFINMLVAKLKELGDKL
jgi:carbon monoxide dehydrogenase subunit G